jgi:hypothetical protein
LELTTEPTDATDASGLRSYVGSLDGKAKDDVHNKNTDQVQEIKINTSTLNGTLGARNRDSVHISNYSSRINHIDITQGSSVNPHGTGIPICAFRKWDESREKALAEVLKNFEDDAKRKAVSDDEKESARLVVTGENRRYWQDRWEVAQAIQHALKEYRKSFCP